MEQASKGGKEQEGPQRRGSSKECLGTGYQPDPTATVSDVGMSLLETGASGVFGVDFK